MEFELRVERSARKELAKAPKEVQERLLAAFDELQRDPITPRPGLDCKVMQGRLGLSRVRVGAWRILYVVHARTAVVQVVRIGRKPAVYG